jgi:uncharacterized protein YdaU (DUF1376 family)
MGIVAMTKKQILTWYPFFVTDYRRDTYHLSLEEDGAYRRLIDEYMITRQPLPNDEAALARIVGIPKTEWTRLAVKVRRFFRIRNDKLWHKRCELELRAQNARHNRQREKAQKGGMAKALKAKKLAASSMLERCLNVPHYKERKKDLTTEYVDRGPVDKCGQLTQKGLAEEAIQRMRARKT